MIGRDSCLPHDTRNSIGIPSFFFKKKNKKSTCSRRAILTQLSSKMKRIWHHLLADRDKVIQEILWNMEKERREPQSSTIPTPRFTRNSGTWTPCFQNCMMETPNCIGKFPDSADFQCWIVNLKTEVCANTPRPTLTTSWIKEVEIATCIDDLMTSQSIEGKGFPYFEMLDAKVASALRKVISSSDFRRRVSVEERAQKYNRFLSPI